MPHLLKILAILVLLNFSSLAYAGISASERAALLDLTPRPMVHPGLKILIGTVRPGRNVLGLVSPANQVGVNVQVTPAVTCRAMLSRYRCLR